MLSPFAMFDLLGDALEFLTFTFLHWCFEISLFARFDFLGLALMF